MKLKKDIFKFNRIYKTIVVYVLVLLALAVFLILYLNQDIRNYIFSDMRLFALSFLLWLSLIISFVTSLFDFWSLQQMTQLSRTLNQLAYLDTLSGIPNRYSCDLIFRDMDAPEKNKHAGCFLFRIANLVEINQTSGHEAGDQLISVFSGILNAAGTKYGFVGRNSGNEFLLIIEKCTPAVVEEFLTTFKKRIQNYNVLNEKTPLRIQYSYVLNDDIQEKQFSSFITILYNRFQEEAEEL